MEQKTIEALFALLRSALLDQPLSEAERASFSEEQLPQLIRIAKRHDLEHLLALGLRKNGLTSEKTAQVEKSILMAAFRCERLRGEQKKICSVLEIAAIPFVPLKGAVLRDYYPESWMRTSCDIDILVREEDVERAASVLEEKCGYKRTGKSAHDISLYSPHNTHLELHYTLIEDGEANEAAQVLSDVWATSVKRSGHTYWWEMTDEMFYFYHIAHMAKHFANGGCGIRPFMDLWILDSMHGADQSKRDALLMQGSLLKFAEASRALSRTWFVNTPIDEISQQMQDYILHGGVYGTTENRVAVRQQKKGGWLRYILSRIFLPYDVLKNQYLILQKHKWLTPFFQVRRWFHLLSLGRAKRAMRELKYTSGISAEDAQKTRDFLRNIGL